MSHKAVRDVFLVLMFAVIAMVFYFLLFGMYDFDFNSVSSSTELGTTVVEGNNWNGVLFYAADAVQESISRYYYNYCYLPSVRGDSYVDTALGGTVRNNILKPKADLSVEISGNAERDDFSDFSGCMNHYSEGWK